MAYAVYWMIVLIIQWDSKCYYLRQFSANKSSEQIATRLQESAYLMVIILIC